MALTENPKLAMIPSGYGDYKVYSVLPSDGTGDFDFVRSSAATRVNKDGLIETVGFDVPRLNYPLIDGVVSGCPSLLLEPESRNLIPYSEDIVNFSTSNLNVTINSNQTTSPSGGLADKIEENNVDGSHSARRLSGIPVVASQSYTFSFFAKKDERSIIGISNTIGGNDKNAFIDIENGVILSSAFSTSSIENYGNGWYKINLTDTAINTTDYDVRIYTSIQDGSFSHQGVVGYGFYIWGAQIEQGSYATSYIPTNGEVNGVTRSAETCNNAGDVNTFNDSEGVLMAEISALVEDGTSKRIVISDGISSSNRVVIEYDETFELVKFWVTGSGTTNGEVQISGVNKTQINKISMLYKTNVLKVYINGFNVGNGTGIVTPIGLDNLKFEQAISGNNFYGNTKQLQYFDTALTDTDLEQLTSWQSFNEMATAQQYSIL